MKTKVPILQTVALTAKFGNRLLFSDLNLCLGRDQVALVGRNGVGKSTLLQLLSGETRPYQGSVTRRGEVVLVPQQIPAGPDSPGRRRQERLREARSSGADLLLLDEPTQDLDQGAVDWLRDWLSTWRGGLLVASHDRRLLDDFQHFFVMAESGCRYVSGTFEHLEQELERGFQAGEERYLQRLNYLSQQEEHSRKLARRRRRKEQYGRTSELDRATSRMRLNMKRNQAQVSHGRINKLRENRLEEVREWAKSARRSLKVALPLELEMPDFSHDERGPVIEASGISSTRDGRTLFRDVSLTLRRERIAVTGLNGAGKTTLLQVLTGDRRPDSGGLRVARERLGVIEQGGANWMLDQSLVSYLGRFLEPESIGERLIAQKFPLALAERPLRTLSHGERVRAALLALLSHHPSVEVLVLDEPSYSLDLLGQRALREVLRAWPGGLVVASHNSDFLAALGVERTLSLESC